jgi:hypothetical protein
MLVLDGAATGGSGTGIVDGIGVIRLLAGNGDAWAFISLPAFFGGGPRWVIRMVESLGAGGTKVGNSRTAAAKSTPCNSSEVSR